MRNVYFPTLIVLLICPALAACSEPADAALPTDIPVMPQAVEETSTDGVFEYFVNASPPEVEAFYVEEMENGGWHYQGLGEGLGNFFLTFTRDDQIIQVSAYKTQEDAYTRVLLHLRTMENQPGGEG